MDDKGQVIAEYALLTFLMFLALSGVFVTFNEFMHRYFNNITSLVALPIP